MTKESTKSLIKILLEFDMNFRPVLSSEYAQSLDEETQQEMLAVWLNNQRMLNKANKILSKQELDSIEGQ